MSEEPDRLQSAADTASQTSRPRGGLLRRASESRRFPGRPQAPLRVADDVAEQASRRIGTLAILSAVTVVAMGLLQPQLTAIRNEPLFRSAGLCLLLASVGLAALERLKLVRPQMLLDAGMLFEVAGAFMIGVMENALAWPLERPVFSASAITIWIAVCALVIPNQPWKSCAAAMLSASMAPAAYWLSAHLLAYPPLAWNQLASITLGPVFIAGWTLLLSTRIYRMETELSRARELGSYRLEKLLGRGGMGEVWRASHRLLRRDAAVKVIRTQSLLSLGGSGVRKIQQRFEEEVQAIASLRSPHTVSLYDFGVSDEGCLYYVMELLDGLDVDQLVRRNGPQPGGRVIPLIRQVCDSLEEAHDMGMVHRDIKPSNLFVCRLGKQVDFVKVLDFGLVKAAAVSLGDKTITMEGVTQGTPLFMAPEQALGDPGVDARADIYSLGCVAYFLLTGRFVFEEPTPMATALAHIQNLPVPPSRSSELTIPASLEKVVMACLEKKREERPQSAAELACLLDACTDVTPWTRADALRWWEIHEPVPVAAQQPDIVGEKRT
jgi:hypothetical protein